MFLRSACYTFRLSIGIELLLMIRIDSAKLAKKRR